MTTATDITTSLPISVPSSVAQFFFACGCLDSDCHRCGYQPDALPYIVAAELRGMAGELMARHDENRTLSAQSAALVLLARAEQLDGAS